MSVMLTLWTTRVIAVSLPIVLSSRREGEMCWAIFVTIHREGEVRERKGGRERAREGEKEREREREGTIERVGREGATCIHTTHNLSFIPAPSPSQLNNIQCWMLRRAWG